MIEINIVIDLKAKFVETNYTRLEKEEIRRKSNAHNVTSLVPYMCFNLI